ncbi:alpha/beta-hydrolase [Hesseltinella vesiculosa]|uniref:Alpha/beta-hydrolase n=1 Tax=Hesseltinella vesiculosa TaxID=101127 RepID=A0A1X2GDI4_9FUNG|nr:alpha/beta-hydrolase [Hesseltinella vesiculosa]
MFEEASHKHKLRMIWPERPGYGLSQECDPQRLNALDWSEALIQLADHLRLSRFSIIAQSVGTVFAMAVAHRYPSRVVGPIYCISPWVSTVQANTFKWTRRLPANLISKTLSFALDMMYLFNRPDTTTASAENLTLTKADAINASPFSPSSLTLDEENAFLASIENDQELSTDFPPHRPLRHMVRPHHISLYLAMNKQRMQEPYHTGQLGDILVALEKYHPFGFSYSQVMVSVSAVWGEQDALLPRRSMDTFANQVRDIRLKILEGEGHDLVWKEGVMTWAIRGIGERWRAS